MKDFDINNPDVFLQIEIQENLRTVIDPELHVNIIDLGLVYEIEASQDNKHIAVLMTMSSRYCPMSEAILNSVRNCLEENYRGYSVEVNLTWEPPWSYELISEEGLKQLGR
ncbi:MAG: metal-sulfur cluster assembly factor [Sphingobacteriaceae bacterium]|jgi:metal-sulfur cluster biosynthetic enzyme|nr:metal-sulfur cluster assembly factor [Sphingobacteriaceae bacterium]